MELLQLRYFQTAARLESITGAANYYHIPQSSMSQTIKRLERELGDTQLFDRRNGRVYLNDRGRTFLAYVDRVLADLEDGVCAVSAHRGEVAGPLRVRVMENHRLVLTCIPDFLRMYPQVSFSVSHGYHEDGDGVYDLCISSDTAFRQLTAYTPLLEEALVLAVHEDHPLAARKTVRVEDLRGEKLITMPGPSALHKTIVSCCHRRGFDPEIFVLCDDPYFVRKYVSENLGAAVAPETSWKGRFRANTKIIPFEEQDMRMASYLLWDGNRRMSAAAEKFKDMLLQAAKET